MAGIAPPRVDAGRVLDEAESFAQQTGITTVADVTGLSITFTVGARPVLVVLELPWLTAVTQAAEFQAIITDGSNTQTAVGAAYAAAGVHGQVRAVERITTPGTYTRKGRVARAGTGTITVSAAVATTTARIYAIEQ